MTEHDGWVEVGREEWRRSSGSTALLCPVLWVTTNGETNMGEQRTISRDELRTITEKASEGVTESTRLKLLRVAETTDEFAVGWFHCDGVLCPARQARRRNQRFQQAFDELMASRFDVELEPGDELPFEPFTVRVAA